MIIAAAANCPTQNSRLAPAQDPTRSPDVLPGPRNVYRDLWPTLLRLGGGLARMRERDELGRLHNSHT